MKPEPRKDVSSLPLGARIRWRRWEGTGYHHAFLEGTIVTRMGPRTVVATGDKNHILAPHYVVWLVETP